MKLDKSSKVSRYILLSPMELFVLFVSFLPFMTSSHKLSSPNNVATDAQEALGVLLPLMDWLEAEKKEKNDEEAITNEVVANAHIENHAMKLFLWADREDRASKFNKNVVKAFYSAGMLFDVLATFGEISPEVEHHRKYAKWKVGHQNQGCEIL